MTVSPALETTAFTVLASDAKEHSAPGLDTSWGRRQNLSRQTQAEFALSIRHGDAQRIIEHTL